MSFYIYLDKTGKEIRREIKGRGRTKSGATLNKQDGNWYIQEEAPEIKFIPKENVEEIAEIPEGRPQKVVHVKYHDRAELDDILKCLYYAERDFLQQGSLIQIDRPVVMKEPPIQGIVYNGAYSRFLIDLEQNEISVWTTSLFDKPPTRVIRGAIKRMKNEQS